MLGVRLAREITKKWLHARSYGLALSGRSNVDDSSFRHDWACAFPATHEAAFAS
jgi:hypothetical protein